MASFTSQAFALSVILFFLFPFSDAKDIPAGDSINGWQMTTDPNALNEWADKNSFDAGDYLVSNFENGDSALEVKQEDYQNCNTTYPITRCEVVKNRTLLYRNGSFFFISGSQGHCQMGERLHIDVPPSEVHVATLYSSRGFSMDSTEFTTVVGLLLFAVLGMLYLSIIIYLQGSIHCFLS